MAGPDFASFSIEDIEELKTLGFGAQGIVIKARIPRFGICAVKYLPFLYYHGMLGDQLSAQETAALRELIATYTLSHHPNIVNFYGIVYKGEREACIVTEFMEGGSLTDYIENHPQENNGTWMKRATAWSIQIARAVAFCHSRQIVHRDIKPDNTVLSSDLKTIKLCDFGMAKQNTGAPISGKRGTVNYMAPEMVGEVRQENYDARPADVFSFGMFLYAIFHKRRPFGDIDNELLHCRRLREGIRPHVEEFVPETIKQAMELCWKTNANERESMDSVMSILEAQWRLDYPNEEI